MGTISQIIGLFLANILGEFAKGAGLVTGAALGVWVVFKIVT